MGLCSGRVYKMADGSLMSTFRITGAKGPRKHDAGDRAGVLESNGPGSISHLLT